jgi:hypothetical protein
MLIAPAGNRSPAWLLPWSPCLCCPGGGLLTRPGCCCWDGEAVVCSTCSASSAWRWRRSSCSGPYTCCARLPGCKVHGSKCTHVNHSGESAWPGLPTCMPTHRVAARVGAQRTCCWQLQVLLFGCISLHGWQPRRHPARGEAQWGATARERRPPCVRWFVHIEAVWSVHDGVSTPDAAVAVTRDSYAACARDSWSQDCRISA